MDNTSIKTQAQYLKAIANFYRLQILNQLLLGEKNVSSLNLHVKVSQPALSQHLSKLRRAGIIGARREQRNIYYYITSPHIVIILDVVAEVTKK